MLTSRIVLLLLVITAPTTRCLRLSRSNMLRSAASCVGVAAAPSAFASVGTVDVEAAAKTLKLLKDAREQLEPCSQQIADGNWDGVRTAIKTAPLANAKALVTQYIEQSGEAAEDLVVPREDFVQAVQLLDMGVYNNNFINEQNSQGSKGRGVKIDRETPLRYLVETKAALDEVIAFKP